MRFQFRINQCFLKFTALKSALIENSKAQNATKMPNRQNGTLDVGLDVGIDVGLESKILKTISENANITIPEMAKNFNITNRTIERTIKRLQEENKIVRVGGKRYGHWETEE